MEINLEQITEEMSQLKDAEARLKFELKQIEKDIEKNEVKLVAFLEKTGTDTCEFNGYSFGWKTTKRSALDQKMLKEVYPEQYQACYLTKESTKFEFKINKVV